MADADRSTWSDDRQRGAVTHAVGAAVGHHDGRAIGKGGGRRWGDWHLAEGLTQALRRLGEAVDVQPHDRADSLAARSADLHLVLRGLAPVRRTSGQRHILWVISHPESLAVEDCRRR